MKNPIGVFDSGYGGLTVLKDLVAKLPQYDYLYLGDNARAPYGSRSFDTIYAYTLQCVQWFFEQGCQLVILACNTASAKALRTIQQQDLPVIAPNRRVLGVIRPTSEVIGRYSKTGHVAVLGTTGTVQSDSYRIEIEKFFPQLRITQEACPMWVPLIENNEHEGPGADYFVEKHLRHLLDADPQTDCLLLACTHYPLIVNKIKEYCSDTMQIISQGPIVAESLADYLQRHPEMEAQISQSGQRRFFTTGDTADFDARATTFYGAPVQSEKAHL
jgi:glutamate racemase